MTRPFIRPFNTDCLAGSPWQYTHQLRQNMNGSNEITKAKRPACLRVSYAQWNYAAPYLLFPAPLNRLALRSLKPQATSIPSYQPQSIKAPDEPYPSPSPSHKAPSLPAPTSLHQEAHSTKSSQRAYRGSKHVYIADRSACCFTRLKTYK